MAVYKVIKTQLGCVELGMHCGKIVWCGFGCASWAKKGIQTCPEDGKNAVRAQNCRVVCPSGCMWAQKGIQTCPGDVKSAGWAQNGTQMCPSGCMWAQKGTQMCPEDGKSAGWAQNCRVVCPSGCMWAQKGIQTCPGDVKSAGWAQKGTQMCPSGGMWAQNGTQMCPEDGESAGWAQNCRVVCPSGGMWAQNGIQTCPEDVKSAGWAQNGTQTCPAAADWIPEYSLEELLRGRGSIFRWEDLQLRGTPLQLRVWWELFNLLPDELITYSELAVRCGYPRAVRAVATAVGRNPVSLIIPCHRVVRKGVAWNACGAGDGSFVRCGVKEKGKGCGTRWEIGNYRWGTELKKRILEWEGII